MSFPAWPTAGPPIVSAQPSSSPAVATQATPTSAYGAYTPEQFAALTPEQQYAIQQNWQQWQAYQQQYAQWHAQYGEQYQKEIQSKMGASPYVAMPPTTYSTPPPASAYGGYTSAAPPPPPPSEGTPAIPNTTQPPPPPPPETSGPPPQHNPGMNQNQDNQNQSNWQNQQRNNWQNQNQGGGNQQQQRNQQNRQGNRGNFNDSGGNGNQNNNNNRGGGRRGGRGGNNRFNNDNSNNNSFNNSQGRRSNNWNNDSNDQNNFGGGGSAGNFNQNQFQGPPGQGGNFNQNPFGGSQGQGGNFNQNQFDGPQGRGGNASQNPFGGPQGQGGNFNRNFSQPPPTQAGNLNQQNFERPPPMSGNISDSNFSAADNQANLAPQLDKDGKSPEEQIFDEQFRKWEEEFENWKKANANHPDRKAYAEYEMKFEDCRRKLVERREQMRKRKEAQVERFNSLQQPPPPPEPPQLPEEDAISAEPDNQPPAPVEENEQLEPPAAKQRKSRFGPQDTPLEAPPVVEIEDEPAAQDIDDDNFEEIEQPVIADLFKKSGGIPGLDLVEDVTDARKEKDGGAPAEVITLDSDSPLKKDAPSQHSINQSEQPKKLPSLFDFVVEKPQFSPPREESQPATEPETKVACPIPEDEQSKSSQQSESVSSTVPDFAQALKDPKLMELLSAALAKAQGGPNVSNAVNDLANIISQQQQKFNAGNAGMGMDEGPPSGGFDNRFGPIGPFGGDQDNFGNQNQFNRFGNNDNFNRHPGNRFMDNMNNMNNRGGPFGMETPFNNDRNIFNNNSSDGCGDGGNNSFGLNMNMNRNQGMFGPNDGNPNMLGRNNRNPDMFSRNNNNMNMFGGRNDGSPNMFRNNNNRGGGGQGRNFGRDRPPWDDDCGGNFGGGAGGGGQPNPFQRQANPNQNIFGGNDQNRGQSRNNPFAQGPNRNSFGGNQPFQDDSWVANGKNQNRPKFGNQPSFEPPPQQVQQADADDGYFRPAKVIDYQNQSKKPSVSDTLVPATVVDYGHKPQKAADVFQPVKTFDYGHAPAKPSQVHNPFKQTPVFQAAVDDKPMFGKGNNQRGKRQFGGNNNQMDGPPNKRGNKNNKFKKQQQNQTVPTPKPQAVDTPNKARVEEAPKVEVLIKPEEPPQEEQKAEDILEDISDNENDNFETFINPSPVNHNHPLDMDSHSKSNSNSTLSFDRARFFAEQNADLNATASPAPVQRVAAPVSQNIFPSIENSNTITIDEILLPPGRASRPKKFVIIMRGPPGSGKSHIAKLIKHKEIEMGGSAPRILSIDDYFMVENDVEEKCQNTGRKITKKELVYEYESGMEECYMQYLIKSYKKTIADSLFNFIVVDCPNNSLRSFTEFYNLAKNDMYTPYTIDLHCDLEKCLSNNVHNRSVEDIKKVLASWNSTPLHYIKLDVRSLLEAEGNLDEVRSTIEMEDVSDLDDNFADLDEVKCDENDDSENSQTGFLKSKWDTDPKEMKLARLDGTSKPFTKRNTLEEYLQMDGWDAPAPSKNGKKRVRWADIEEKREQDKMRAIGFVVGQTDWNRMLDPTGGSSALTKTKFIERVNKRR